MQTDTIAEWQRLTQHYREMGDEELGELYDQIADLTEVAQQALRDEMNSRGPKRSREASEKPESSEQSADLQGDRSSQASATENEDGEQPHEFTWKTLLCECNERDEALQIRAALKDSGIESWIEGPRSYISQDSGNPRVLVAADQLEQAQEIIARPIPQAIIEQFKNEAPAFELPVCPKCGAEDPVLEGVDPVNLWRCESCENQWADSVEVPEK